MSIYLSSDFDRRNKELQVHCSTGCGLQFTVGNLWSTGHRQHDVDIKHAGASTIRSSRDSTYIDRVIKIRTHYEAKMKLKLSEVRQSYSLKYQEFINGVPIMTHPTVNSNVKSTSMKPGYQVFRPQSQQQSQSTSKDNIEVWLHGPR